MQWRKWFNRLLILGGLSGLLMIALHLLLRPSPLPRTEIFRGVYLTVLDLPSSADGGGRVMITEVHWDTPGIRLQHRPYDYFFSPENVVSPHYNLSFADWALFRHKPAVLVNTTRYTPEGIMDSFPGMPVRSLETLVVDGQVSHLHEHSYLMFWDAEGEAHMQTTKPPSPENLEAAVLGMGIQGVSINTGSVNRYAVSNQELAYDRTFIGFDPTQNILFLLAFEKATALLMTSVARDAGVLFGGMLDSGDATSMVIGAGARGLLPHTGIRNRRPLGPYLLVYADPLP